VRFDLNESNESSISEYVSNVVVTTTLTKSPRSSPKKKQQVAGLVSLMHSLVVQSF